MDKRILDVTTQEKLNKVKELLEEVIAETNEKADSITNNSPLRRMLKTEADVYSVFIKNQWKNKCEENNLIERLNTFDKYQENLSNSLGNIG